MDVVSVSVSELRHAEYNPRKVTPAEFSQIKKSVEEFGFVQPLVVNRAAGREGIIVGGNQRYEVAKKLGMKEVPVVYVDIADLAREKELNIRLNRNQADWDWDLLKQHFNFNELTNWGFTNYEIDTNLKDLGSGKEETEPTPEPPETPRAEHGMIYMLGKHRLLCGDSTNPDHFKFLMREEKAKLIFTDPPYSVNYKSSGGNSYSKGKYGGNAIFNDDKTEEEALDFYIDILKNLYEFSTDDVSLYWWFANKMNWINRLAWIETGWYMAQILTWLKEQMIFSMGQDFHRCYEPVMFGWKKGKTHYSNKRLSNYTDCFILSKEEFSDLPDVWFQARDKMNDYVHPTQKPVQLCHRALRKNSREGDIVLDAFGGSGSTIIACEQMSRVARSIELDPKFADVIIQRFCNFTKENREDIYRQAVKI
jgi:DNA modification methylase